MREQCDLVMKGGITSGVVYPKLIAQLAKQYDFKNIGGTSAGAIAAAACAAAQYGRNNGNINAFDTLEALPEELGRLNKDGKSRLFSLFQPSEQARQHFSVLTEALNQDKVAGGLAIAKALVNMYQGLLLAGLLLGGVLLSPFVAALQLGFGYGATLLIALLLMLVVAGFTAHGLNGAIRKRGINPAYLFGLWGLMALTLMVVANHPLTWQMLGTAAAMSIVALLVIALLAGALVVLFLRGLLKALHANHYGLCSGRNSEAGDEGLTDWLTHYLNSLAGLDPKGKPLLFQDLWGNDWKKPTINLEVMTSAISQQMVYAIPFRAQTPEFFYDRDEWARLFPTQVIAHLDDYQAKRAGRSPQPVVYCSTGKPLYRLPMRANLPVVVAVRMSLSFPLLLSAIPLYAIDLSVKETAESKNSKKPVKAKRVWFSDGGIGSNMPLHMFDSMLPHHPTFAINLKPEHPSYPIQPVPGKDNKDGRIYLPDDNNGGRQRYWPMPDDSKPVSGLASFFGSILNTMQSWRDELMFPYAGFRDRIVQISLQGHEGGLNLNMPPAHITALGDAGKMAAERLIDKFHPQGAQTGKGWEEHREIRLKAFLGVMQPAVDSLEHSMANHNWSTHLSGYNPKQRQVAVNFLVGVQQLSILANGGGVNFQESAPKPLGHMKITPKI
ncbi:patatin-like phospholipase family protein [Pseudomonas sp. Marseille-P9899]|uniref:patatin-like phospholipase family protein n=1 Tax=Pseudomonas sp. Marseille-P9899 TaxID=2730401 RepID=UPI001C49B476|nr:patatin-like phospholipase family protein [Pseudomonas sp. Marseille-P9899]